MSESAPIEESPSMVDLKENQLPQLKTWKIGGKYRIILDVEMVRAGKGYDGSGPHRASFKVISAQSAGPSKAATPMPPASRKDKLDSIKDKAGEA